MQLRALRTHLVAPDESLLGIVDAYIPRLKEKEIVAITSKVVSLCEGRVVPRENVPSKELLIKGNADAYLDLDGTPSPYGIHLTIKHNILIPSAGIDESNGNGVYILYPEDIQGTAVALWEHLRNRDRLHEVGVVITDSHTTPLRRGVIGLGLGWCGFKPLESYIGRPDCFGVPLKVTQTNTLDALAAAAVYCMGEGNEQTPIAVISHAPRMEFQERAPTEEEVRELSISLEEDLYLSLLKRGRWVFNP